MSKVNVPNLEFNWDDLAFDWPDNPFAVEKPEPKIAKKNIKKYDISDWRAWAHNKDGDCPCGISRKMCDYHR
jgi:hypothetical protein